MVGEGKKKMFWCCCDSCDQWDGLLMKNDQPYTLKHTICICQFDVLTNENLYGMDCLPSLCNFILPKNTILERSI